MVACAELEQPFEVRAFVRGVLFGGPADHMVVSILNWVSFVCACTCKKSLSV